MTKADGKANARVGDMVTCPRCRPHVFPIVTGDDTITDWGIADRETETLSAVEPC
nr:PAAR domain-containing protein [Variovorax boronicumulans]